MHISLGTRIHPDKMNVKNGYGYATDRMLDSLTRLGHEVNPNDEDAPVEIWFDQPHHWKFRDNQYKIGYHPWESTHLLDGWVDIMNQCDEIWTPSPLIAEWYQKDGISVPIHVYEHGVDKIWQPKEVKSDKMKFLHVGGEAARKGGWDAANAFRFALPHADDVEFTMKLYQSNWNISKVGRISIIVEKMELPELVDLFQQHQVYVYPSAGEGFGLTPLQAMACGIPTITVPAWAPYKRFLDPNLCLESKLKASPWQDVHPGKVFKVTQEELRSKLVWVHENYDQAKDFAMSQVDKIKAEYDWDLLTEKTFKSLENRVKITQKSLV